MLVELAEEPQFLCRRHRKSRLSLPVCLRTVFWYSKCFLVCDDIETKRYQKVGEMAVINPAGNTVGPLLETGKYVLLRHLLVIYLCGGVVLFGFFF